MKKAVRAPVCMKEIEMTLTKQQGFTLVELLVVIGILGILSAALFPAVSSAVLQANMTAVGTRGKDIFVAITAANMEREPLGLGTIWPTTDTSADSGLTAASTTSTEYFKYIYNEDNRSDSTKWSPLVDGFDYSKLAGAGVKASGQKLDKKNNMWIIACNLRDEMEDIIPALVTRNIIGTSLVTDKFTPGSGDAGEQTGGAQLEWTTTAENKTPFSDKGFVVVRKGGAILKGRGRYRQHAVVYNNQFFDISSAKPALVYLEP